MIESYSNVNEISLQPPTRLHFFFPHTLTPRSSKADRSSALQNLEAERACSPLSLLKRSELIAEVILLGVLCVLKVKRKN